MGTQIRSLDSKMLSHGDVSLSRPLLASSQLRFRLGLARGRMSAYPLDSMDFVMMDLERPDNRSRHAHWCAGDLTGRLLEFLSCAEGVDGRSDPRLDELFERILKQRKPSGFIGRYTALAGDKAHEDDPLRTGSASRLFHGLLRYHELSGDARALEAATGMAEQLWNVRDEWRKRLKAGELWVLFSWVLEPFARLYGTTKDHRWLEFCGMLRDYLPTCESKNCHSHGFMSALRGLQVAALVTGDPSWNEKPELNRRLITERRYEMPDGCVSEGFPYSGRNEGCSIADWLMLNLNAGLLSDDDAAYDKAERIFWNALAFNQFITGGFGHRGLTRNGYGVTDIGEAWWCCTQSAGQAMAKFARHAVTCREGAVRVNLLVPGQFAVLLPGGARANVRIATNYPSRAEATVEVDKLSEGVAVKLRIPSCVRNPRIDQTRVGQGVKLTFRGELGHRIEQCHPGVILTYGPLVLVPGAGVSGVPSAELTDANGVPAGYIPQLLPPGVPNIKLDAPADADGFVRLPRCPGECPLPEWSYFDEGPGSPTWVEGAPVEVQLKCSDGRSRRARFTPECYNTSVLALFETPVVFQGVE